MNIGMHVSISKGLTGAVKEAAKFGCTTFQIFSRNPRGKGEKEISKEEITEAQELMKEYGIQSFYIHTPYYTNLASPNEKTFHSSITYILKDLEKAKEIGASGFVMHMGNHVGSGEEKGMKRVIRGLEKILAKDKSGTPILMENTAGAGTEVGNSFESLAEIIKNLKLKIKNCDDQLKICLDTCHAFGEGYDWEKGKVIDEFDKIIGLKKLSLIHVNDSLGELGSHKDRHAHLGEGNIGLKGFEKLMKDKRLKDMDFVLETPNDPKRKKDIEILRSAVRT